MICMLSRTWWCQRWVLKIKRKKKWQKKEISFRFASSAYVYWMILLSILLMVKRCFDRDFASLCLCRLYIIWMPFSWCSALLSFCEREKENSNYFFFSINFSKVDKIWISRPTKKSCSKSFNSRKYEKDKNKSRNGQCYFPFIISYVRTVLILISNHNSSFDSLEWIQNEGSISRKTAWTLSQTNSILIAVIVPEATKTEHFFVVFR